MTPHQWIAIALAVVLYLAFHRRHYRSHRRRGLSVKASMRGPFGVRITKWFDF